MKKLLLIALLVIGAALALMPASTLAAGEEFRTCPSGYEEIGIPNYIQPNPFYPSNGSFYQDARLHIVSLPAGDYAVIGYGNSGSNPPVEPYAALCGKVRSDFSWLAYGFGVVSGMLFLAIIFCLLFLLRPRQRSAAALVR